MACQSSTFGACRRILFSSCIGCRRIVLSLARDVFQHAVLRCRTGQCSSACFETMLICSLAAMHCQRCHLSRPSASKSLLYHVYRR